MERQPALLAAHDTEAGRRPQALASWQQAGQRAIARSAYVEAMAHLTRGLAVLESLPETPARMQQELALQMARGLVLLATEGYTAPEVAHAYTRAQALCHQLGERPQSFPELFGLGMLSLMRAQYHTVQAIGEQILRLNHSTSNPRFLVAAHGLLGVSCYYRGEGRRALPHLKRALACYDPELQPITNVSTYGLLTYGRAPGITCQVNTAWVLGWLGYADQAQTMSARALTAARQLAHPLTLMHASFFAARLQQQRQEVQQTRAGVEALRPVVTAQKLPLWVARATMLHGWVLAMQGQVEDGIAHVSQGLATCRALGIVTLEPSWLALLAELYGKAGQPEAGLAVLAEALALVAQCDERMDEAELHRLTGELLLMRAPGQSDGGVSA